MIDVKAQNVKIWRKDFQGKNGEFYKYTASVSGKNKEGRFINAYIPVKFSKKADAPEKIDNGAVCDFEGFLSVESYKDREGNERNQPIVVVMKAHFEGDSFEELSEDLPF